MIGDAPVVALSEAVHGGAEPLQFRNRLLQYLVEEKGFTVIAIESGVVEGRLVHDYVRSGAGDLARTLADGFSWSFGKHPQNRALVSWLRDYNIDPKRGLRVNFYGFDVPGSPGNPAVRRGTNTALLEALSYLSRVDKPAATVFRDLLGSLVLSLQLNCVRADPGRSYSQLGQSDREIVTQTIADLINLLERKQADYISVSSAVDHEWAVRAAIGAHQVDKWLRHFPIGWQASDHIALEQMPYISDALNDRDRAQADNLDWIFQREGPSAKVLIYASRYHMSAATCRMQAFEQHPAGTYLRRRLGNRLITIGNMIGGGEYADDENTTSSWQAPPQTIDGLMSKLRVPGFLLDVRRAPESVSKWLELEHPLAPAEGGFKLAVGRAFDILFYIDKVTPA